MLKMCVKLVEHCLGNALDLRTCLMLKTWIMAWPNDMGGWVGGTQWALRPFEIAEQLVQVGDMVMNALIVRPPAMCFRFCLESQDKCINILLAKRLERLGMGVLFDEK